MRRTARRRAGERRWRPGRFAAQALAPLAALVLLLAACRQPPRHDLSLLVLAEPVVDAAAPPATIDWGGAEAGGPRSAREPQRIACEDSERLAVLTAPGFAWEMPVEVVAGDRLRWSAVAAPPPPASVDERAAGRARSAVTAGSLELRLADGRAVPVASFVVPVGEPWSEHEAELPADALAALPSDGGARLRLVSDAPLAWAELRLLHRDPAAPRRPNIVLVSIDTLRADRMGLYGGEHATTPHLEGFASDALVFDRALSTSTWTLPSHGSLLTGLLPDQHGLIAVPDQLPPDMPTVAARLRRLGYHTVAFTDGGFLRPRWGLSVGFDRWDTTPGQPWEPKDVAVVVDEARRWLAGNGYEPFFLFVHTYEVHQPYRDVEGFADPFLPPGAEPGGALQAFELAEFPADPAESALARALYDGGVARADHYLGGWLEELRDGGALADTAVIVTSDHGEELGDHGTYEHAYGRLYDENVHVPLIVRPAGGTAGRHVAVPASGLDVAPTLLAWAGAADPSLPGEPLEAVAADGSPRRPVFVHGAASLSERYEQRYRIDRGTDTVILDRKRALVLRYDRAADPGMRRPRRMWQRRAEAAAVPPPPADPVTAELLSRLQMVQAWVSGAGLATRLPAATSAVQVRRTSALVPSGVWAAAVWRPLGAGNRRGPVLAGWPSLLRFEVQPGGRPRRVFLEGVAPAEGSGRPPWAPRELRLTARPELEEAGWNPITGVLPQPGEVFHAAPPVHALAGGRNGVLETLELDEATRQELRALGYLR